MKRIPFYVALAVLCLAMTDCTSKKKMEIKMKPYPQTAKVDVSDNYHGTVVADPYRWLEDDNSAETAAWVAAENEVTFDYLSQIPYRPAIDERLTELWNYEKIGAPTKVGDRYVLENMRENGYAIGGEQSGHVILLHHATTGDGELTAGKLLKLLAESGKKMSELNGIYEQYPQVLVNVTANAAQKAAYKEDEVLAGFIENEQQKLMGMGRVLVRVSGTEPKLRVMVEGQDLEAIHRCADRIVEKINKRILKQ